MTDNEIIKALECCKELICKDCPIFPNSTPVLLCKSRLEKEALDLIKRQQAKIAELHEINEGLAMSLLCDVINKDPDLRKEIVAAAEYNAITEFAERLIQETRTFSEYDKSGWECDIYAISAEDIDRIAKEMTEGDNGA